MVLFADIYLQNEVLQSLCRRSVKCAMQPQQGLTLINGAILFFVSFVNEDGKTEAVRERFATVQ